MNTHTYRRTLHYLSYALITLFLFAGCEEEATKSTDNALDFDGLDDYVALGSPASLLLPGDITIEAWIKVDTYPASQSADIVFRFYPADTEDANIPYGLTIEPDGSLRAIHESGAGIDISTTSTNKVPLGAWTHVAVVRDVSAKTYTFIINGSAELSQSYSYNPTGGSISTLTFSGNGNFAIDGTMDEIRIWNIVRTQAEIQASMGTTLTGSESGLVGYWRFDELEDLGVDGGGNDDVRDFSGNGNNGDLVGDVTLVPSGALVD